MVAIVSFLAAAFVTSRCCNGKTHNHCLAVLQSKNEHSSVNESTKSPILLPSTMDVPLFPLRKSVRVPSDSLTLNLYEERYLAMSESILSQEKNDNDMIFGTIYSSDKPQIVKQGKGAIVPLLEEGDVGVICLVTEWKDEMVPTRDPAFTRRRIQLNAVAVARFQIADILNDGIQPASFIQAKVSLLQDNKPTDTNEADASDLSNLESEVWKRVLAKENEEGSAITTTSAMVDKVISLANDARESSTPDQTRRTEAFSFAAAKLLPLSESPKDMQEILKMTNTNERLKRILEW